MYVSVAFTPALFWNEEGVVCVAVDPLRATSSLVTMFARRLEEALVAETVEEARELARRLYRSYRGSAEAALEEARHAAALRAIGLGADVTFCARRDVFEVTPRLERAGAVVRVVRG